MRSLDASRVIIASVTIAIMAVVTDWRFDQNMQASIGQGKFEPFSAFSGALFFALCVGVAILLMYVTLMHFYNNDIRIVRLAMSGIVLALVAGAAMRWAWATYVTDFSATRHIVTRVSYMEDASLVGLLVFGLAFALCCTAAANFVEHRS